MEINYMPDEILLLIFEKLPAHILCAAPVVVCRRWRDLITSQILVLHDRGQLKVFHSGLSVILAIRRVPTLHAPSQIISSAATLAPRLRELTVHCKLPLDLMDFVILSTLQNLQHLDVFSKHCTLTRNTVVPRSIKSLVVNDHMTAGFLTTLCQGNRIRRFQMYGRSFNYKPTEMVKMICTHSAHLMELTLRCSEMTDARYSVLCQCRALRSLRLYSCWLLTSKGIHNITCLTGLHCLHLTGARMVRQRGLSALVAALPPLLVELNLSTSWFDAQHCAALARRLPALRRLELWRGRLDGAALVALAEQLPRLERLDTDVACSEQQVRRLATRPALTDVRCCLPAGWRRDDSSAVRVVAADKPPGVRLRGDGDGPSADAFYMWHGLGPGLRRHFRPK